MAIVGAFVACTPGRTQTNLVWLGGNGNWATAANWSGGAVPGSTDSVFIDNGNAVVSSVTLNTSASIRNLTISSGDMLTLPDGHNLTFNVGSGGSALANAGTLALAGSYLGVSLIVSGGDATLSGAGTLTMTNYAGNTITGSASTDRFVNQSTVQGSGNIGNNILGLANSGLIVANQSTPLILDPGSLGATNTGTLRATSGATLHLSDGTYANTGGTIEATGTGSVVELSGATVTGGTLASGTLFETPDGATTYLSGTITNGGTFSSTGSYYGSTFALNANDVTLAGGGTVLLSNYGGNNFTGAATLRLINQDNTIQGSGQLGNNTIGLTNRGTIISSGSVGLTIDPGPLGAINSGTMKAASGSTLSLQSGTYTNFESTTPGLIRAEAGGVVQLNNATVTGGTVDIVGNGALRFNSSTLANLTLTNSATGTLSTNGGTTYFNQVTLTAGLFTINDGTVLEVSAAGTFTNNGNLALNGSYYGSTLRLAGGDVTLSGGGTVTLNNYGGNYLTGAAATDRLINQDNTISGSGYIGNNSLGLVNRGTILANQSTPLVLDPSAAGVTNAGTLKATAGATLTLQNGTFTNHEGATLGLIRADAGSLVQFDSAVLSGGTLDIVGNGELRFNSSALSALMLANSTNGILRTAGGTTTLDQVSLNNPAGGQVIVNDGSVLQLAATGTYANSGNILLAGSYYGSTLRIVGGDVTLTGGGTLTLSNYGGNYFTGAAATDRLVNQDNTIRGAGNIGSGVISLVNRGTIEASDSTALTLQPASAFTNQGTLRASGSGGLNYNQAAFTNAALVDVSSRFTASGTYVQTAGSTVLNGGTLNATSFDFQAGTLAGSGTLNGPVTNSGFVEVGSLGQVGQLVINGTFTLGPSSLLSFEIGSAGSIVNDHLQAGATTLAGGLSLRLLDGVNPALSAATAITLIDSTNLAGTFAGLADGAVIYTSDGFGSFRVNYTPTSFYLSNFVPVPEPATYVLLALGVLALLGFRRTPR